MIPVGELSLNSLKMMLKSEEHKLKVVENWATEIKHNIFDLKEELQRRDKKNDGKENRSSSEDSKRGEGS